MSLNACPFHSLAADSIFRRWDLGTDALNTNFGAEHQFKGEKEGDNGLPVSTEELTQAAREAWRNSARCVGRLHWRALQVLDARSAETVDDVFEAVCTHLRQATNGGAIRPTMTVFAEWKDAHQAVRIWNHQAIRYAGYCKPGGGFCLGDPANVELTRVALSLGWQPPTTPGRFDVLPLILQVGEQLAWRVLPEDAVLEVPLRHPKHAWFEKLGLRWHAVPAITDMIFATSSAAYSCAPFNGWYMGTEIGARNLADDARYAQLPVVASHLGLEMNTTRNLWRDHALLVLNEAVLHSFETDGVKLVDHHQATAEFEQFCQVEARQGRQVSADWSWIVPPTAGSTTPVFHRSYSLQPQLPNLLLQAPAWQTKRGLELLKRFSRE